MNLQPLPGFQRSLMEVEICRFENISVAQASVATEGDLLPFLYKAFLFSIGEKIFALWSVEVSEEGGERTERNCFIVSEGQKDNRLIKMSPS